EATAKPPQEMQPTQAPANRTDGARQRFRRWQLVGGGSFLLLFGLALGILLTQSLRPRTSEQDMITGDFLTGTSGSDTAALLREGKRAFDQQEFAKAIDAFKRVLEREPDQPEAHSYMGFILVQAGHGDGALMAFEKALASAPSFPMALWGKGMVLYRDKQDYAGARAALEKLLQLTSPGEQRNEIAKVLAEIPSSDSRPEKAAAVPSKTAATGQRITGQITVDSKLKDKIGGQASLFIIVRQAGGAAGPPLAVKKIDSPSFPLSYSVGPENVMIQGTPLAGQVNITARLDKDGNAMTREAGNLLGDFKNNPVEVGLQNVDIVLDRLAE
ncbi:MAG: tetratricopeptide repeat protein, partial [Deltaproteobacteria bacterium]|nr:tetratricopeptide repeat protein [Deltaproteobacteria bacterium]